MKNNQNKTNISKFLLQSLNMALRLENETSYSNSFDIEVTTEGFYWIPRVPCSFIINSELYQKIYSISSAVLFPLYTLLQQDGAYFVALNTDDIHTQRAFFFPWMKGIPKRLLIKDINSFKKKISPTEIYLMKDFSIDFNNIVHLAIAGGSGSGKSYILIYLLHILHQFCELVIIDPKYDSPSRWATKHNVRLLYPQHNRSQNDFTSQVNEVLGEAIALIQSRQSILFDNPDTRFQHYVIVIDELLALSSTTNKPIKDAFFSLLSQIALLGRSSMVHLLTLSQRYDHNALPVACREQFNLMIQLGNINKNTTQFLFPSLNNSEEIVIPKGKGTGLIQVIDGILPSNVFPFLSPTFYEGEGTNI